MRHCFPGGLLFSWPDSTEGRLRERSFDQRGENDSALGQLAGAAIRLYNPDTDGMSPAPTRP